MQYENLQHFTEKHNETTITYTHTFLFSNPKKYINVPHELYSCADVSRKLIYS